MPQVGYVAGFPGISKVRATRPELRRHSNSSDRRSQALARKVSLDRLPMPAIRQDSLDYPGLESTPTFPHTIFVRDERRRSAMRGAWAFLHDGAWMVREGMRLKDPELQKHGSVICEVAIVTLLTKPQSRWIRLN